MNTYIKSIVMSKILKNSLYKSTEFRVFTGVAAGIADYFNTSHTLIRCLFILLTLASGLGLVLYMTLSILLPTEDEVTEQENIEIYYNAVHGKLKKDDIIESSQNFNIVNKLASRQNIFALFIICIGVFFLQFKLAPWELIPEILRYPSIVITIGIGFILKSVTQRK